LALSHIAALVRATSNLFKGSKHEYQ